MSQSAKILTGLLGVVVVLGALFLFFKEKKNAQEDAVGESEVRVVVSEFSSKITNVSLLLPQSQLRTVMEKEYAQYVSAELMDVWAQNPTSAIGDARGSSSPYDIEIVNMFRNDDGSYIVEGHVRSLEDVSGTLFSYPVTLGLQYLSGMWMITESAQGFLFSHATTK